MELVYIDSVSGDQPVTSVTKIARLGLRMRREVFGGFLEIICIHMYRLRFINSTTSKLKVGPFIGDLWSLYI